jgi:hypothetical protein
LVEFRETSDACNKLVRGCILDTAEQVSIEGR